MGKSQHVVKTDGGWGVRGEGNSRLTSEHRTKDAAINAAVRIAKHQESEVVIMAETTRFKTKIAMVPTPAHQRIKNTEKFTNGYNCLSSF